MAFLRSARADEGRLCSRSDEQQPGRRL